MQLPLPPPIPINFPCPHGNSVSVWSSLAYVTRSTGSTTALARCDFDRLYFTRAGPLGAHVCFYSCTKLPRSPGVCFWSCDFLVASRFPPFHGRPPAGCCHCWWRPLTFQETSPPPPGETLGDVGRACPWRSAF